MTVQDMMNAFHDQWQRVDNFEDFADWRAEHPKESAIAALGHFNYQIQNNGIGEWLDCFAPKEGDVFLQMIKRGAAQGVPGFDVIKEAFGPLMSMDLQYEASRDDSIDCLTCDGSGKDLYETAWIDCEHCDGNGWDEDADESCTECGGNGQVEEEAICDDCGGLGTCQPLPCQRIGKVKDLDEVEKPIITMIHSLENSSDWIQALLDRWDEEVVISDEVVATPVKAAEKVSQELRKPVCKLTGTDGNIFAVQGAAAYVLRKAGLRDQEAEMRDRVLKSGSYDEALGIILEYVEAA